MTELFAAVRKKIHLEQQKESLLQEKNALEKKVFALKILSHNTQAEVVAIEGFSLKGLLLKVTGKYQERLENQRREAKTAKITFDSSIAQLNRINAQLEQIYTQLPQYDNAPYVLSSALAEHLGDTPCSDTYAPVLEFTHLLHSGESFMETGQALYDTLTDIQAYISARQSAPSSYSVPSTVALQGAIDNAQKTYRTYWELANTFCQQSAAQGFSFDTQVLLHLGPDYLKHLRMATALDNRVIEVQNTVTAFRLRWKSLRPQLEEQLCLARMNWMHALCQYEQS